jgi:hypothetical protein
MPLSALTSTTARYEEAGFAKLVDASATMGADLTSSSRLQGGKQNWLPLCVQLDGSVVIWHVLDWLPTACCSYGARSKNENRACQLPINQGTSNNNNEQLARANRNKKPTHQHQHQHQHHAYITHHTPLGTPALGTRGTRTKTNIGPITKQNRNPALQTRYQGPN